MRLRLGLLLLSALLAISAHSEDAARTEALKKLIPLINDTLKAGEKITGFVEIFGQREGVGLISADDKNLTVMTQGNPMPVAWAKINTKDLMGLAKAAAGENPARMFTAGEIAVALGYGELAKDLLARVTVADASLAAKAKELAAKVPDTAPPPGPSTGGTSGTPSEAPVSVAALPSGAKQVTVSPEEDTTTPLHLPDGGLQSRIWSQPTDNYLPRANILYARFTWKDWGLDGSGKVGHFKGWMAKKRFVGFRMYCNTDKDIPDGVPLATANGQTVPKYWDPKFLELHKKFLQSLAREIGENPYLSYMDIGGVGNTGGEWLVYPDDKWGDKPIFTAQGYTDDAKDKLVWDLCKMYREVFPHVRLYLAGAGYSHCKDKPALIEYMKKSNIGIRSDGLCWPSVDDADTWSVRKSGTHKLWLDVPFQWEGSYSTMEWEKDGWDTAKIMDRALDFGPISFCYADADKDAVRFEGIDAKKKILDKVSLKLGYRIAVTKATYYDELASGGKAELTLTVVNRGASKIYLNRDLEISFLDGAGKAHGVAKAQPVPATSQWAPGQDITVQLSVVLPSGLASGSYKLAIGMLDDDPRRPDTRIEMAMKDKTPDNRYILGPVRIGAGR